MILLADVGNRRLKWAWSDCIERSMALFDADNPVLDAPAAAPCQVAVEHGGDVARALDQSLDHALGERSADDSQDRIPERIRVSWVATGAGRVAFDALCRSRFGVEPEYAVTAARQAGIENRYTRPETLGVDRWLAMLGARALVSGRGFVVVDAGTAVTVDYVSAEGVFAGGIIFPGVRTMVNSLNTATGQIRIGAHNPSSEAIELQNPSTENAVANGVLHTCLSSVQSAIARYRDHDPGVTVILTGGDAELLARHLGAQGDDGAACALFPGLVPAGLLAGMTDAGQGERP